MIGWVFARWRKYIIGCYVSVHQVALLCTPGDHMNVSSSRANARCWRLY